MTSKGKARLRAWVLLATALVSVGAGVSYAQRVRRVLHRPIPGDVPLEEAPNEMPAVPPSSSQSIARAMGAQSSASSGSNEPPGEVQRPRPSWDAPAREMDRQTRSPPNAQLRYTEVFTPSVQPFKRGTAHDMVDENGRMTTRDPSLRPLTVGEAAPTHWTGRRRARFTGDLLVELSSSWATPVPGVAGEQRVLQYATNNGESVQFLSDSAGNLFVRGMQPGTVRLTYVFEAPDFAFAVVDPPALRTSEIAARVPEGLRPLVPQWLEAKARVVLERLRLNSDTSFQVLLDRLVAHFRAFRDESLGGQGADLYTELALGGVGACRHRAYAMMLTMHALGIPTRYVGNEAHAWVEVWIYGGGWSRVDLGGWNVDLVANDQQSRPQFDPQIADRFARPSSYQNQFSSGGPNGGRGGDGGTWVDPDASASMDDNGAGDSDGGASSPRGANSSGGRSGSSSGGSSGGASSDNSSAGAVRSGGSPSQREAIEPEDDAPKAPTNIAIASVLADDRAGFASGAGFARGSMVRVVGFVRDVDGVGINGLAVELQLVRNGRSVQGLGTAASAADGRFEAHVLLSGGLEAGEYELRAATPGDARYAPSAAD
jgi:hypothetical protein